MASQSRVAAVTGANKGIGLAIVRNLALKYPKSAFKAGPLLIYLTARSAERGEEAVRTLNNDPQLKQAKVLAQDGGDTTISFTELDISEPKSIDKFTSFLKNEHPGGIDFFISNAGVALQGFNLDVVKNTLKTNYYGSFKMMQEILPLIRDGGRFVFVSSSAARLDAYSPEIRDAFLKASTTDVASVTALMEKFQTAVSENREKEAGFPSAAYAVSKAGGTAMTKVIALEEAKRGRGILVNSCHPGYVNTDMTKGRGVKTPDEGARTPVMLALEDLGGKTGEFWENGGLAKW